MNPYEITARYGPKTIVFELSAESLSDAIKLGEARARETFKDLEILRGFHGVYTISAREVRGK